MNNENVTRVEADERDDMLELLLADLYNDSVLNDAYQNLTEGRVEVGMRELISGLQERRMNSSDQEWNEFTRLCLHHPVRELVHQDPFTLRAFKKPRGYAGDAELLDFIYGREDGYPPPAGMTELGHKIFEFTTLIPAADGVLARRSFIADLVDRVADEVNHPHIFSVAAGHLREAGVSRAVKRKKIGRYVALDSDPMSLEEITRCYGSAQIEIVPASVRKLLTSKLDLGHFDLIYSTGLFDYVRLSAGQRLIGMLFDMLRAGGRLVVANFLPEIRDVGYMESFMDWPLIYRTRREMMELTMTISQSKIRDIRLFTEENENIIFLEITSK